MRSPSISVLMPVRDAESTVEAALASVFAQSLSDWELVLIDDGSRDATPAILERLARAEPRVTVIRQPALGITRALQVGGARCRGEFIARFDADDWMHPDRLALQSRHLNDHPETGVVSCRVRYGGTQAGYGAHIDWLNAQCTHREISLRRFIDSPVAHPSVMFRRRLLEHHGGYEEGHHPEDYDLWLRWLAAGVRFDKLSQELVTWNDPPGRLSRTHPRYSIEAIHHLKCRYLAAWLNQEAPDRERWLWGAGRVTRRRFDPLPDLVGFIDIDPAKAGRHRDGRPVRLAHDLPDRDRTIILTAVAARGARDSIRAHLESRGWVEGRDFLQVA